jgi:AcrR family transcriptional regulator
MVGFQVKSLTLRCMTKRGQYATGRARRDEILARALEVIARNGYRRTSFREIADTVGLSKTGMLHHFANKEELFREIIRLRDEQNFAEYTTNAPDIIEGFAALVEHNAQVPGLAQLFAAVAGEIAAEPDHPSRAFLAGRYEYVKHLVADAIRDQQSAGRAREDVDPGIGAALLIAAADGIQTQWLLDPSIDMTAHLRALWDLAIGVGPTHIPGSPGAAPVA